eukprot:3146140-Lingulodinium_polyedra.AAC.1
MRPAVFVLLAAFVACDLSRRPAVPVAGSLLIWAPNKFARVRCRRPPIPRGWGPLIRSPPPQGGKFRQ